MPPVQLRQLLQPLVARPVHRANACETTSGVKVGSSPTPRKRMSCNDLSPARRNSGRMPTELHLNLKVAGSIPAGLRPVAQWESMRQRFVKPLSPDRFEIGECR